MLRVGVVGAGNHSKLNHGPALERCRDERPDELELRAVCDLDCDSADRYADRFGFDATYEDVERMLTEEPLDAVVAVTPVDATREVAGELLTRGVPVLVEKPPGETVAAARELRDVATRNETPHAVSFNRRFNPAVVRAREWIADDAAGKPPTHVLSRLLRTGRFENHFVKNTCLHAVDTVCSILGRPTRVSARRWRSHRSSSRSATRCAARATFADASAQFTLASDAGRRVETYELLGPAYAVLIDAAATRFRASVGDETVASWQVPEDAPRYVRNGTLGETRAFLDAVRRGERFTPTLADTVPSVDLAWAMERGETRELGERD